MRSIILCGFLCLAIACGQDVSGTTTNARANDPTVWPQLTSPIARDSRIESRIDELLASMTVEQKVGQMIQAEIRYVEPRDIKHYHLGSVLNGGGGFPNNDKRSSINDWVSLADAFYDASVDTSDGGPAIPVLWGTDSVHGASNVFGATLFPHNIGLGAMRNPKLVERIGAATAVETATLGIPWTFAPTVAVVRDDRWGRTYEGYSEEPGIVKEYAAALVKGLQGEIGAPDYLGDSKVLATAKHFIGDGGTANGTDRGNNLAADAELFAIHGQGYVSALAAGVRTIMVSYNSSRGLRMHGNKFLLTDILKNTMNFDGFLIGDWDGHADVAGCSSRSCAAAINAGIDMIMVPKNWKPFYRNTLNQVKQGKISMERVDDAVRRILRVKLEAGLFEAGRPSARAYAGKNEFLGSAEHREVAREAVRESLVLLKNNGQILPLPRGQKVLVTGNGADDIARQSGGWTLTWQGTDNSNEDFPGATSIFSGIASIVDAAGGQAELSTDGSYSEKPDVAIVVWGEKPYAECIGDREHLNYDADDKQSLALLKSLQDDGIPVVSVFLSGRPMWVNPHLNASDGFVAAWWPGSEGAGIADVLFQAEDGEVNFDFKGKLSFSWPATAEQTTLNIGDMPYEPLFAYGYGLTYGDQIDLPDNLSTDAGAAVTAHHRIHVGADCGT